MPPRTKPLILLAVLFVVSLARAQDWPQGAGPNGDFSAEGDAPPLRFSATRGENIIWRTPLPETGQGGIAIVGNRVFVTTLAPWDGTGLSAEDAARYSHAIEKRSVVGKHIDAHCLDASTGELLWTRRIEGVVPSIYSYPFSDATSASPVASTEHVWFTNAGGRVACFTHQGELVWARDFEPTFDGPFNKQFEPFLIDDPLRAPGARTLIHMEPFEVEDGARWHFLVGLDAMSGELAWRSEIGLTHYNAPTLIETRDGVLVLHARGGPHAVPERPVGLSLTRANGERAGETVWNYDDPRGNHEASLQTMASDADYVYWLLREPRNVLVVLDRRSGAQVQEISLVEGVTVTEWDTEAGAYRTRGGVDLERGVFPARYSMHAANGALYFQCYATAWGKPTVGPPYSFARVQPGTADTPGRVEYLEVPTAWDWKDGEPQRTWRTPRSARAVGSHGQEVTGDDRSRWDGWDWVFNGSPTRVGDRLYFTLASGTVYVISVRSRPFDEDALLALCDLGPTGEVWSANSVSFAHGRLYHRTAAELLCIGTP